MKNVFVTLSIVLLFNSAYATDLTWVDQTAPGEKFTDVMANEIKAVVNSKQDIVFTPIGNISSVTIPQAIAELDTEKQPLNDHLSGLAELTPVSNNLIGWNTDGTAPENKSTLELQFRELIEFEGATANAFEARLSVKDPVIDVAWILPFCNYTAQTSPGVINDQSEGYSIGSIWIDITAGNSYQAQDVSTGAAVWVQIDAIGSGGTGGYVTPAPTYSDATCTPGQYAFADATTGRLCISSGDWDSFAIVDWTNLAPDNTPDGFTGIFLPDIDIALSATDVTAFETYTVAGVSAGIAISTEAGAKYQIDALAWTSSPGTVSNGNVVGFRQDLASASNSTETIKGLTIGTETVPYSVTTLAGGGYNTVVFADDFSSNDTSAWTSEVDPNNIGSAATGAYVISATPTNYEASVRATVSSTPEFEAQFDFRISSVGDLPSFITLVTLRNSSGEVMYLRYYEPTSKFVVMYRTDSGSNTVDYVLALSDATDYVITMRYKVSAGVGFAAAYVDGVEMVNVTNLNTGSLGLIESRLGLSYAGQPAVGYDITFDNFAIKSP